jgi:signal transduction histidine kinase/2-hydroxychromene-2-carboxylate isomerase
VRTLNIGILVAIAIASATTVVDVAFGRSERVPGALIFFGLAALILKLQHAHKRSAAVCLTSVTCMALIWAQFLIMGPNYGVHLWLIALIIFPVLSMPRKDTVLAIALGAGHVVILTVLGNQDRQEHGYSTDYLATLVLASILILAMTIGMRVFLDKIEDSIGEARARDQRAQRMLTELSTENPNPVFQIDPSNKVIFSNPSGNVLLKTLGKSVGSDFPIDLVPYGDRANEVHSIELTVGNTQYSIRVSGLADHGFWNAYAADTTQLHELQDYQVEIESVLTTERDISRLKEEFLASLSHELRTPLNAIMGLSEALNEEIYGPLTEKQSESLLTIWGSGQTLLNLINDMLDFSRIGAGQYPTLISQTDLRSSANSAIYSCREFASESGVEIQLEAPDQPTMATVDGRHIIRILKILVHNGIKFTPEGGQVGVGVTGGDTDEWITLRIWDTGIGIRAEKLETLFDPFSQVDGGLSRQYEGAGLGLALCARLCRLMNADISVESTPGQGTTFTLQIPTSTPQWIEVFSDLRCPFCYILDEWLEEANMSHLVRWRGVEQMPGLSPEDGASDWIQVRLAKVLDHLKTQYPDKTLVQPKQVSNTQRALAAVLRVGATESDRQSEARSLLYRAIWKEGKDITDWPAIKKILTGFKLDDLNDDSFEMMEVVAATKEWRERGDDRIPAAFAIHGERSWHGLGQRADLIGFIENELSVSATKHP